MNGLKETLKGIISNELLWTAIIKLVSMQRNASCRALFFPNKISEDLSRFANLPTNGNSHPTQQQLRCYVYHATVFEVAL